MYVHLTSRSILSIVFILIITFVHTNGHGQAKKGKDKDIEEYYPKRFISKLELSLGSTLKLARGPDYLKDIRVPKFGLGARIGLIHELNSRFELSANLSYQQKGIKFKVFSDDPDYNPPAKTKSVNDITLNYFETSIIPRLSIDKLDQFYIGGGPYLGYLINSRIAQEFYRDDVLITKSGSRLDSNGDYKDFDFGASFMIGSNFIITKKVAGIVQFYYSTSLTDINKPTIDRIRNNTFSFQIGLNICRNSYLKP